MKAQVLHLVRSIRTVMRSKTDEIYTVEGAVVYSNFSFVCLFVTLAFIYYHS